MSSSIPSFGTGGGSDARRYARRLDDVRRRVEASYRNGPPQRARGPAAAPQNLTRIWMPTGISAGTFGTPAVKTDAVIAVRSGNGWTITGATAIANLYNSDTTAVTGAKAGWALRRGDGSYELVIADC